jgi:hypothetical protein
MGVRLVSGFSRTCCLLILAATASASRAQTTTPAPQTFVAIGCLTTHMPPGGKTATFIVTDARGERPTIYRLDGDSATLKLHVGHTVEVRGPLTPGSTGAKDAVAAAPLMKVQTMMWIASTCQAQKK